MDRSGLFAMYNNNVDAFSTAASIYYGLFSMQHRGMDTTGICINQNGQFKYKKEEGIIPSSFIFLNIIIIFIKFNKFRFFHLF